MDPFSTGKSVVDMVTNFVPPHDGEDERVYRWRVFIAVTVGINMLTNIGHILWACGWLSFIGLHGFVLQDAYSQDYVKADQRRDDIDKKVDFVQQVIINTALKEAMKNRCQAVEQNNQQALDAANTELARYEERYYTMFRRTYFEQPCSVVLIAKIP